jgi:hypothetical protein
VAAGRSDRQAWPARHGRGPCCAPDRAAAGCGARGSRPRPGWPTLPADQQHPAPETLAAARGEVQTWGRPDPRILGLGLMRFRFIRAGRIPDSASDPVFAGCGATGGDAPPRLGLPPKPPDFPTTPDSPMNPPLSPCIGCGARGRCSSGWRSSHWRHGPRRSGTSRPPRWVPKLMEGRWAEVKFKLTPIGRWPCSCRGPPCWWLKMVKRLGFDLT